MVEKSPKNWHISYQKMLISLKIATKTPNVWDFRHNNSQFERFHVEYTENSGYSMRFFQKIGKFTLIGIKLTTYLTNWVENSKKLEFSLKQVQIFVHYFYKQPYVDIY